VSACSHFKHRNTVVTTVNKFRQIGSSLNKWKQIKTAEKLGEIKPDLEQSP
jgi:hypothetical protein